MSEPHERLQEARRKAGFENASDAARSFGWNENTYRSHENGERGLRPGVAARYAKAFKTMSSWLLLGEKQSGFEISLIESDPLLILRDEGVLKSLADGTTYLMDATTFYSNIDHKFTIVETQKYAPRYRIGDLVITTQATPDNVTQRDDLLFTKNNGNLFFGSFSLFKDIGVALSLDGEIVSLDDIEHYDVVMAIVKRSFYEIRSEIRLPKSE